MAFNFSFWDLGMWLATSSIIMLVGSEFLSPHFGRKNVLFNLRKLRLVAVLFGVAFLFTIAVRVLYLLYI